MSGTGPVSRPLSLSEHAALLWVLQAFPNRDEAELLYGQSKDAVVQAGSVTMLELTIAPSHGPVAIPDGPLPVRAVAYDNDGRPLGELLVWISSGYLAAIEYAWYSDSMPTELPSLTQLRKA